MNFLKKKVGRPSNEEIKKRRIFFAIIYSFVIALFVFLSYGLTKLNNKDLSGYAAKEKIYLSNYFESEEDIENFVKIGNKYAFISKDFNDSYSDNYDSYSNNGNSTSASKYKYFLTYLKNDYSIESDREQLNIDPSDFIQDVYQINDNSFVILGNNYIYKYQFSNNQLESIKFSIEDIVGANSSIYKNKLILYKSSYDGVNIKIISLDTMSLIKNIAYSYNNEDLSNYFITLLDVTGTEDDGYAVLLNNISMDSYTGSNSFQFDFMKLVIFNSLGDVIDNKNISKSDFGIDSSNIMAIDDVRNFNGSGTNFYVNYLYTKYDEDDYDGLTQLNSVIKYVDGQVTIKNQNIDYDNYFKSNYNLENIYFDTIKTMYSGDNLFVFLSNDDYRNKYPIIIQIDSNCNIVSRFDYNYLEKNDSNLKQTLTKYHYILDNKIFGTIIDNDKEGYFVMEYDGLYTITVSNLENGSFTIKNKKKLYKENDKISFDVVANDKYVLDKIEIYDQNNNDITTSIEISNNTFNMPKSNIIIKPIFKSIETTTLTTSSNTTTKHVNDETTTIKTTLEKNNPITYDNIKTFIILGIVSIIIVGISILLVIKNKKN